MSTTKYSVWLDTEAYENGSLKLSDLPGYIEDSWEDVY